MTQSLHPAAQKGFSLGAELYQQVRPSYPHEIATFQHSYINSHKKSGTTPNHYNAAAENRDHYI